MVVIYVCLKFNVAGRSWLFTGFELRSRVDGVHASHRRGQIPSPYLVNVCTFVLRASNKSVRRLPTVNKQLLSTSFFCHSWYCFSRRILEATCSVKKDSCTLGIFDSRFRGGVLTPRLVFISPLGHPIHTLISQQAVYYTTLSTAYST